MISTRHRPATRSALPNPKTISGSRKPGCREPPTDGNRELRSPATGAPGHRQPIPARPASVSREVSPSVDENRTAQLRRKGLPVRDVAHSRRVPAGGQDGALAVPQVRGCETLVHCRSSGSVVPESEWLRAQSVCGSIELRRKRTGATSALSALCWAGDEGSASVQHDQPSLAGELFLGPLDRTPAVWWSVRCAYARDYQR